MPYVPNTWTSNPLFSGEQYVDQDLIQCIIDQFQLRKGTHNHGHAADLICRMCGSRGPFVVDDAAKVQIEPDGGFLVSGQQTWFRRSKLVCGCGFSSTLDEFLVAGLDRVLIRRGWRELPDHDQ